jgi:hypothetical protein
MACLSIGRRPVLDHLAPSLRYVRGNVVIVGGYRELLSARVSSAS